MALPLVIARTADGNDVALLPALANRHGLITGATGTGKPVTMQVVAESFSRIGVPTFLTDVKGDVSGIAVAGTLSPKLKERLDAVKFDAPTWEGSPVTFWDVRGERGHPVRATVSDMGPLLLGRLLNLSAAGSTGPRGGRREGMLESAARSAARTIGSQVARSILRGALGSMGGRSR